MKNNFVKNWKIINVFAFSFLFLAAPFPVSGSQEEIKYFGKMNCSPKVQDLYKKYDGGCKFYNEQDVSVLQEIGGYHKVYFKGNTPTQAINIRKHNPNPKGASPAIINKWGFDSKGRIIVSESSLTYPENYRLCKTTFEPQAEKSKCWDINGKPLDTFIAEYTNNFLSKTSNYDGTTGKLKDYVIYDQENKKERTFSSNHELVKEIAFYFNYTD